MDQEVTTFTVNGRGLAITWHLRMPFVNEDTEYSQRFAQIADKKSEAKAIAEYQIYADTLSAWSDKMPEIDTGKKDKDGNPVTKPLGEGAPAEAIKAYFAKRSAVKEWHALAAISSFRDGLFPTVTFHEHSGQ